MYYFHLSEANLVKAHETGVAGWCFTTRTNTPAHTHTDRQHGNGAAHTEPLAE